MSNDFKPGDVVAQQVQRIPRSGIREFFDLVQGRRDVISLGVGEPDFVTPWHIREAAIYSLERGRTSYTSNLGLPRLREAISEYVGTTFGVRYDSESEILVSVGVSEALDIALRPLSTRATRSSITNPATSVTPPGSRWRTECRYRCRVLPRTGLP